MCDLRIDEGLMRGSR